MFLADLVRHLDVPHRISLLQASSYRGETTTAAELVIDPSLLADVSGRHVLLLDDILDTGHTLLRLTEYLNQRGVVSLRTAVLLRKIGRQEVSIEPDYIGFAIPDAFVVGYGLDYNDDFRHLPYVGVLPPQG
jgi:hypoxanthine phosphoribosyltransferase